MVKIAGNYPNVPSWRMPYDRDGTQGFLIAGGSPGALSSGQMIAMNNESDDTGPTVYSSYTTVFIFPELRDIDGYYAIINWNTSGSRSINIYTSVDTTNGVDGAWVLLRATYQPSFQGTPIMPEYRQLIQASTALAVRAIKFIGHDGAFAGIHLFGEIAPGENPNRLALWHPSTDNRITPAYFDWGNVPRGSSADRTFRVKNLSPTQTANSIRVAQEILTDTTPSVVGQHTLMKASDAASFLAQVNVGALAPGAISEVVTLRRVTPSNAVMSVWCHRVFAEATTWS